MVMVIIMDPDSLLMICIFKEDTFCHFQEGLGFKYCLDQVYWIYPDSQWKFKDDCGKEEESWLEWRATDPKIMAH